MVKIEKTHLRICSIESLHLGLEIQLLDLLEKSLLHAVPTNFYTFCASRELRNADKGFGVSMSFYDTVKSRDKFED